MEELLGKVGTPSRWLVSDNGDGQLSRCRTQISFSLSMKCKPRSDYIGLLFQATFT